MKDNEKKETAMETIGLSNCGKAVNEQLFIDYAEAGITAMEISRPTEEYESLDYESMIAWGNRHGVTLWSCHLPFMPFDTLDISAPHLAAGTVARLMELIRRGAGAGVKLFVVHPSGEPIEEADRPVRMACAKESLRALAEVAAEVGATIAVENLPRTCLGRNVEEMEELVGAHPNLRVCFDTNHLLSGDPVELIHRLGDKLVTVHVSDYDFINERHWLPGEGKLDWNGVVNALRAVGYAGPWLYEIPFNCPNTIIRPRDLTCADFAENAKAVLAGKKPPILSTPKPNLGMWD